MKIKKLFKAIVNLLVIVHFAPGCVTSNKSEKKPNILFIYTDDQAYWTMGASGNNDAFTPNIDRLVSEGAILTNSFVVTPVCSPSRASLMTSRYSTEVGITDWLNEKGKSLTGPEPDLGLDTTIVSWVKLLQKGGYMTGLVGKWHLGTKDEFHPTRHGYNSFMGFRGGGIATADPILEKEGHPEQFYGLTEDILTENAIEFIIENKNRNFCLSLHYRAPHTAWLPVADVDMEPYINNPPSIPNPDYPDLDLTRLKRMMPEYLASVRCIDRNIGSLLNLLDSLNILNNTIIIFTSDNGYSMGHNGIWHKGNGHWILNNPPPARPNIPVNQRPNLYDYSIKVPTVIHWPEKVAKGTAINNTITNLDWFPTILSLTKIQIPDSIVIRGKDFSMLLEGKKIGWNNDLYAEYSTHHQSFTHMRMYRTEKWKLIKDFLNPDRDELYNLEKDPSETVNLIKNPSPETDSVKVKLTNMILLKMKELNDPVLIGLN